MTKFAPSILVAVILFLSTLNVFAASFDLESPCDCVDPLFQENYRCAGPIQLPAQNLSISPERFEVEYARQLECQRQRRELCCKMAEKSFSGCINSENRWQRIIADRGITALRVACRRN
jgi:hypothetical protein